MKVRAEQLNDGLYRVWISASITRSPSHALWARVRVRKAHRCWSCETEFPVSSDLFMPIGNQDYRMRRLCGECLEAAPSM